MYIYSLTLDFFNFLVFFNDELKGTVLSSEF
jgi:hypothetical protein